MRKIEAEDVLTGVIRFESGALANVQASITVFPKKFEESITIFWEKGTIKIGGSNALYFENLEVRYLKDSDIVEIINRVEVDPSGTLGHQRIIEELIIAIKNNIELAVTGEDGKRALKLVLAFYKSAESKKIVNL